MRKILINLFLILSLNISAQEILSLKKRAEVINKLQQDRFQNLLPDIMNENDIDMWVIMTREYNEDPVIKTMLPPTWLNARRRTILVFSRDLKTGKVKSVAITRYPFGKNIPSIWVKEEEPNQLKVLSDYIEKENPTKIGINFSKHESLSDGLSKNGFDELYNSLSKKFQKRLVSAEKLSVAWIETRTDLEMTIFSKLVEISNNIIKEAFSTKVITPGVTTTDDVVWWMREKVIDLGIKTWFHPTVDVQRKDDSDLYSFDSKSKFDIIQHGDLLHCDFGISYLTLNTDCQQLAYVLKPGEKDPPNFLVAALKEGNRVQDIFTNNFKEGATGNQILLKSLKESFDQGLRPQIYTHPLGLFGHSAGTAFGMWDSQGGVPHSGDHPLHKNTTYAIELNTKVFIPEWEKDIRIMLEVPGFFGDKGFRYINGRQTELILVGSRQKYLE